jgi:hypothetical protein
MEILIGRHVIHITCCKVACNPTKFEYFSKVYYDTSFENYVVYEAVMGRFHLRTAVLLRIVA